LNQSKRLIVSSFSYSIYIIKQWQRPTFWKGSCL